MANIKREWEGGMERKCVVFCRKPTVESQKDLDKNRMERIKANDPAAMREVGVRGQKEGKYDEAFEYFSRAAELGYIAAHFNLFVMYQSEYIAFDENTNVSSGIKQVQGF